MVTAAPPDRIRVLAVDDDQLIVDGMARRARREIEISRWCRSAAGGAAMAIEERPDVVAMDLGGVGNPWRAIKQIRDETGDTVPVLIVTGGVILTYADLALLHGASGIACKRDNSIEIVAALKRVAGGGEYWSAPWDDRVAALRVGSESVAFPLDNEELEIVNGIVEQETPDQIAARLEISAAEFEQRLTRLRQRAGADNDAGLIIRLLRLGWIDQRSLF